MAKTFTFALDDGTRARLEKIAKENDRPLSYVIREAIKKYLEENK